MSSDFKRKHQEGIDENQETSEKLREVGEDMTRETAEINSLLSEVHVQDQEDVQAIESTRDGYQGSFDSAFQERVERPAESIEEKGRQLEGELNDERGNVQDGISKLERAAGVSEIGRENAEAGRTSLERSNSELEEMVNKSEGVREGAKQDVERQRESIRNAFRR